MTYLDFVNLDAPFFLDAILEFLKFGIFECIKFLKFSELDIPHAVVLSFPCQ